MSPVSELSSADCHLPATNSSFDEVPFGKTTMGWQVDLPAAIPVEEALGGVTNSRRAAAATSLIGAEVLHTYFLPT
ncbi:hypothetical protein KFK09_026026 [Dendrobium nobile]|uniref:Uncharacterized protein n=1 Tax=Dendrobium nobile TaxID=94219 RepID=A0A8T3A5G6_DENNO|nr:hypothetical protein KFK09_026026 [Dendrobium nobile]